MLFPFSSVLCAAPVRPKEENWGVGGNSCQKTSSSSSSWIRKTSTSTSTTAAQKTAMYARTHAPTQTGSFPPVSLINFKKISLQISASLFCALSLHAERLPNAPGGTRRRSSSSSSSSYDLAAMVAAATAADNNKNKSKRPKREQKKFSRGGPRIWCVFARIFIYKKKKKEKTSSTTTTEENLNSDLFPSRSKMGALCARTKKLFLSLSPPVLLPPLKPRYSITFSLAPFSFVVDVDVVVLVSLFSWMEDSLSPLYSQSLRIYNANTQTR